MSDFSFIPLAVHPHSPGEAVRRVAAQVDVTGPDSLRLQFVLEADPERISIPAPVVNPGRADKLWLHTCFEAFVGWPESPGYLELNFSPAGEWAAYGFDSYRQGMRLVAPDASPLLTLSRSGQRLALQAVVCLRGTEAAGKRRLRLALSAVVEDREGRLSYCALRHPPGRPDFHHPESFALALELPATT